MDKLSDKIVMVVDSGQFVSFADSLAKNFKKVYYYKPFVVNGFPTPSDNFVGYGYNLELVDNPFYDEENVSCYIFTDLYQAGLQKHLLSLGKNVFGAGDAETIETDRFKFRKMLEKLNLPHAPCVKIKGIDKLETYLKTVRNKYVKISKYRNLHETFKHISWDHSKSIIDSMRSSAGNLCDFVDFVVEDTIKSIIEIGFDGFIISGEFPNKTPFGFEIKDICYLAKIMDYEKLPKVVQDINTKMKPYLKGYKMLYSNEIRMTSKTVGYLTDPCMRNGSPPSELYTDLYENLAEIIYFGAQGKMIQPKFKAKYGGELIITSDLLACGIEQCIEVPEEIEQWVKLRFSYKYKGKYYCIPTLNYPEVGAVIAIGDSPEEVIEKLKDYCSKIIGHDLIMKTDKLDSAIGQLSELEKIGIKF
jgi:hypothetical protein